MIRRVSRYAFRITAALLTLGILVLGSFLVLVAVPDLTGGTASAPSATPVPSPAGSPRSAMALSPVGIEMPSDAECDACHMTTTGTVGTKPIPMMAHPLYGWTNCTACHTVGSLVKTAPGHTSLHKDECLICHKQRSTDPNASKAPIRPEHMGGDKPCTSCHGVDEHAPLPEAMKSRGNNCWICHNGTEYTYLFEESPSPSTGSPAPSASPVASGAVGYILNPGATH